MSTNQKIFDDLPGIVLASLRRELNKPEFKKLFPEPDAENPIEDKNQFSGDLKYFCNRYYQADAFDNSFYITNYQNPIHLFLLPGQKDDNHASFVNRYACQFRYEGKNIVEVSVVTKYFPLQSELQLLGRIKNEIRTQLIEELTIPLRQITTDDIFEALTKAKKDFLIINLIIESSYLKENNILIYKKQGDYYLSLVDKAQLPASRVQAAYYKSNNAETYWEIYPAAQINVLTELCKLLKEKYNFRAIIGYDEVDETKLVPGPLFPIQKLRSDVFEDIKQQKN